MKKIQNHAGFFCYDFLTVKSPEKLGLGTEDYNTGSPSGGDRLEKVVRSLSITHKDRILTSGVQRVPH